MQRLRDRGRAGVSEKPQRGRCGRGRENKGATSRRGLRGSQGRDGSEAGKACVNPRRLLFGSRLFLCVKWGGPGGLLRRGTAHSGLPEKDEDRISPRAREEVSPSEVQEKREGKGSGICRSSSF